MNTSTESIDVTISGSIANAVGFRRSETSEPMVYDGCGVNEFRDRDGLRGLLVRSGDLPTDHLTNGTMVLASRHSEVSAKAVWNEEAYGWDGLVDMWAELEAYNRLTESPQTSNLTDPSPYTPPVTRPIGSLALHQSIAPGSETQFEFFSAGTFRIVNGAGTVIFSPTTWRRVTAWSVITMQQGSRMLGR